MMEKDDVRAKKNVSYHIFTYYPEKPSIYTEYSKAVNDKKDKKEVGIIKK